MSDARILTPPICIKSSRYISAIIIIQVFLYFKSRFVVLKTKLLHIKGSKKEETVNHFLSECPTLRSIRLRCLEERFTENNKRGGCEGKNILRIYRIPIRT